MAPGTEDPLSDDRSPEEILRVVTINAGSLLEPGWDQRRAEIVAWLDILAPDIVCLQEIWESDTSENTALWIAAHAATRWHMAFGGAPFAPELWPDASLRFGSAVLSRWPIDKSDCVPLPIAPDEDPFPRQVPWELVYARTAGLDVFSTHLASAPPYGNHRRVQVAAIDAFVKSVRGELDASPPPGTKRGGMPAILCGDFNAEPDSDEIRFLCGLTDLDGVTTFWQDAWRVAGTGPGYTQDWRTNPLAAGMNLNRKRIDYVFVGDPYQRQGDAGRVLSAALAFDEPRTGVIASDHLGLVVDVVFPDKPSGS